MSTTVADNQKHMAIGPSGLVTLSILLILKSGNKIETFQMNYNIQFLNELSQSIQFLGSVGRALPMGPRFEPRHWQNLY